MCNSARQTRLFLVYRQALAVVADRHRRPTAVSLSIWYRECAGAYPKWPLILSCTKVIDRLGFRTLGILTLMSELTGLTHLTSMTAAGELVCESDQLPCTNDISCTCCCTLFHGHAQPSVLRRAHSLVSPRPLSLTRSQSHAHSFAWASRG